MPATQAEQVDPPVEPWKRPAAQGAQAALPAVEKKPATQLTQVVVTVASMVAEYLPAGQLVQLDDPTVVLYFPAAQTEQSA